MLNVDKKYCRRLFFKSLFFLRLEKKQYKEKLREPIQISIRT